LRELQREKMSDHKTENSLSAVTNSMISRMVDRESQEKLAMIANLIGAMISQGMSHYYDAKNPISTCAKVYQSKVKFGSIRVYCDLVNQEQISLIKQLNENAKNYASDHELLEHYMLQSVYIYRKTYMFFKKHFPEHARKIASEADYWFLLLENEQDIFNALVNKELIETDAKPWDDVSKLIQENKTFKFNASCFAAMKDVPVTWKKFFIHLDLPITANKENNTMVK
jgi:hypothetical protein